MFSSSMIRGSSRRGCMGLASGPTPGPDRSDLDPAEGEALWRAFARPGKKLKQGEIIRFAAKESTASHQERLDAEVEFKRRRRRSFVAVRALRRSPRQGARTIGRRLCRPTSPAGVPAERRAPRLSDPVRARTRRSRGADRGPAFHANVVATLAARGVSIQKVTLHVGAGTFLPVKARTPKATKCTPNGVKSHADRRCLNGARGFRRTARRGGDDELAFSKLRPTRREVRLCR